MGSRASWDPPLLLLLMIMMLGAGDAVVPTSAINKSRSTESRYSYELLAWQQEVEAELKNLALSFGVLINRRRRSHNPDAPIILKAVKHRAPLVIWSRLPAGAWSTGASRRSCLGQHQGWVNW